MTAKKSRVRPHIPVTDLSAPPDPLDKAKRRYCDRCGLAIVEGDPRHTPPMPSVDDVQSRAAGEAKEVRPPPY